MRRENWEGKLVYCYIGICSINANCVRDHVLQTTLR